MKATFLFKFVFSISVKVMFRFFLFIHMQVMFRFVLFVSVQSPYIPFACVISLYINASFFGFVLYTSMQAYLNFLSTSTQVVFCIKKYVIFITFLCMQLFSTHFSNFQCKWQTGLLFINSVMLFQRSTLFY